MTGTISPVKFAFPVDGPKLLASLLSVLSSVGRLSKAPTKNAWYHPIGGRPS